MNPTARQRQLLYTLILAAALLTIVLRSLQHRWNSVAIAVVMAGYVPWAQRRYLRLGLWSWLNGKGWHWIDEPTTQSDNPPSS